MKLISGSDSNRKEKAVVTKPKLLVTQKIFYLSKNGNFILILIRFKVHLANFIFEIESQNFPFCRKELAPLEHYANLRRELALLEYYIFFYLFF